MQKKIFSQLIVYSVVYLTLLSGVKSPQSLLTPKQFMPAPTNQQKPFTTGQPIRISPPPTMAPKPIVTPPATASIAPIVPQQPAALQPVASQPVRQTAIPAVQPIITPVPAAAPTEDKTILVAQQKFYNEISDKTTSIDLNRYVTELIKDIINPATMKTIYSVSFIEDAKALIDLALKQLDIIFIQAKTSSNTDKQAVITTLTTQLKVAQDDISQYLQKIKTFSTKLQATKTISSTQVNEIIVSFSNLTQQISGLLPNEVIQSYITGIDDLVKNAKANGQSNASAFKMLFDAVSKQQFLSIAAKQQILALLENRLRTLPRLFSILTAQGAAATIRPEIQAKIQEAATKASLNDKIRYLRIVIPLINALALQGEKNALLSILNEILVSLQTLKKTDVNELNALFSDLLNNKFILNSQQQYESGEPWQKI